MLIQRYFEEDDGQPQGGGDGKQRATDVLDRFGRDAIKLAEKLAEALTDNYTLREQRRTLRQEVGDLKTKLPGESSVILPKEDAALLTEYKALGEIKTIKQAIDVIGCATAELSALKREKTLAKAADAAGFKAAVLVTLAGDLDIQTKEKDGKPAAVVVKDGKETPLQEYAATEWRDFLPALKVTVNPPNINANARNSGGDTLDTEAELQRKRSNPLYS